MKKFNKISTALLLVVIASATAMPAITNASTVPSLGTAGAFGVLSSTFTRNIGTTVITGSAGYTTLSGGGTDTVSGTTYTPSPSQAGVDQNAALSDLNTQASTVCTDITGQGPLEGVTIGANPPGTFPAGCYKSNGAMDISVNGIITLDGGGDPNAVFIFKPGGALTTGADSSVKLASSTSACNVFWAPTGATTLGANTSVTTAPSFVGSIFRGDANGLSITLGHFANILGRTLSFGSTVTADTNIITSPSCNNILVPANLRIVKNVDNTGGGTATSSDFSLHVKLSSSDVAGSPLAGTTTPGNLYLLSAGSYVISEDANSSYTTSFSDDCPDGSISLLAGDSKVCTVTNTFATSTQATSTQATSTPVITTPVSVSSSGGGSIYYGCKDLNASNYEFFAASNPALCLYGTSTTFPVVTTTTAFFAPAYTPAGMVLGASTPSFPNTGINDEIDMSKSEAVNTFTRTIGFGSEGDDVAALQTALLQSGFLVIPQGVTRGYYGELTRSAVSKYQTREDLPSVGVFGPNTRANLISKLSD